MRRAINKHKTQMELQNGMIIIIIQRELDEMKAVARTVMKQRGGIQCVFEKFLTFFFYKNILRWVCDLNLK